MNYRATLEAEKNELFALLNGGGKHLTPTERARGVAELRRKLDELNRLDAGESFVQVPGDTLGNIVAADIRAARKVLK